MPVLRIPNINVNDGEDTLMPESRDIARWIAEQAGPVGGLLPLDTKLQEECKDMFDSKHFYPYIYKSQINEILNWIFPGRSSKKLIYTPMKRTKEQEKEYFTGLQSNNRTKNITANNRTRQNLKKKKKNYTHFF